MKSMHNLVMGGSVTIDWSLAPEGTTAYSAHPADVNQCWIKNDGRHYFHWFDGDWCHIDIEDESEVDVWHIDKPTFS